MAQNPRYTRESMFLRVHSTLPPFPFLQTSNWKRPSCTQKATATSSPAGCPGKRTATRYCRRWFQGCLRQRRPRKKNPAEFLREGKPSPVRTRFNVRRKTNATGRAPFYWTPPPRAMSTKTGKRNPDQDFPSKKNS